NNSSSGRIYVTNSAAATAQFNSNIEVVSTAGNGIYFGNSGGTTTLTAGNTIVVGASGFTEGTLYLRNFIQNLGTSQNLILSSNAQLTLYNTQWGGNLSITSPRFFTRESIFTGNFEVEKTGASDDASSGGNTFNGQT